MKSTSTQLFSGWFDQEGSGVLDVKMAIDSNGISRREIAEGFLRAEEQIRNGEVLEAPPRRSEVHPEVLKLFEEAD